MHDIVVGASVTLECALHALHNACLGVDSIIIELPSIVFLRASLETPQVRHLVETVALFVVHI